ncbi:UCH-domain-containing protein, partial [Aureobasidium melanogenum]
MPKKQSTYRSYYHDSPVESLAGMDSPLAETMAIPVFHSKTDKRSPSPVLNPTLVTITREEAKDYDAILRKVLTSVATMTTKRILDNVPNKQDHDSVTDDAQPDTDVSMRDGSQTPSTQLSETLQSVNDPRNMFELRYVQATGDMFMTGTNAIGNSHAMQTRVRNVERRRGSTSSVTSNTSGRSKDSGYDGQGRSSSDDDQDADPMVESFKANGQNDFAGDVQSDDESGMGS